LFRAVPDAWWEGGGITLRDLRTSFGVANLEARRGPFSATVDLALTGPALDKIALRYLGAKRTRADGRRCDIQGEVMSASNMKRLVIDF
jgi:hypothetical protein